MRMLAFRIGRSFFIGKYGVLGERPRSNCLRSRQLREKSNGKIFAQIYPYPENYKITQKCTADAGQFCRIVYPEKVVRGYHCPPVQQPHWNTVYLDDFPDEELLNMIDHAYETILASFSKKVQKQILEG